MRKITDAAPAREYDPEIGNDFKAYQARKAAEEALLDVLMGGEIPKPQETPATIPLAENAGVVQVKPEDEPEPACAVEFNELKPEQRMANNAGKLRLYNRAIEALRELADDDDVRKAKLCGKVTELEQCVRRMRIQVFEPMIDWNALARGAKDE